MEEIKEKLLFIIVIIVVTLILVSAYYFLCVKEFVYYTQIDNTKIEEINSISDDMKYQYTLECYSENGIKKEIQFKTSRQLREGAYLKLEIISATGVHSWEEIEFEQLPYKVQKQY